MPADCINQQTLADPPVIEPSGKYLVIVNATGETVILAQITDAGLLVWNGSNVFLANGTDTLPITLPKLKENSLAFRGLCVLNSVGRVFSLVNDTATKKVIKCVSGVWALENDVSLPTGKGVVYRANDVPETVTLYSAAGLFYLDANGIPTPVAGVVGEGKIVKYLSGIPTWAAESTGSIATGAATTGLETVLANSTNNTVVNISIPQFKLTDGTSEITVNNVALAVNISSAVGPLGKETGMAEAADTWYYVYIISDGTGAPSGVISASPVAPNLSGAAFTGGGYTFYGLCTIFRNNSSSNIVPFYQKGRKFWIDWDWGLMCLNANVTTSFASVPEAVGAGAIALTKIVPPMVKSIDGYAIGTTGVNQYLITGWDGVAIGTYGIGSQGMRDSGIIAGSGNFYGIPIFDPANPRIAHRAASAKSDRSVRISSYEI